VKPGNPMLAALRDVDREAFRARLRIALDAREGDVRAAAADLGVHYTTLYRWLEVERADCAHASWRDLSSSPGAAGERVYRQACAACWLPRRVIVAADGHQTIEEA
jgi:hypothetical protein